VAAELGSLSLEFTRLAQITGNATYYDAVARITDALEAFQMNTTFPGLWPIHIDASGCKRIKKLQIPTSTTTTVAAATKAPPAAGTVEKTDLKVPGVVGGTGKEVTPDSVPAKKPVGSSTGSDEVYIQAPAVVGGTGKEVHTHEKRDIDDDTVSPPLKGAQSTDDDDVLPPSKPPSKSTQPKTDEPSTDHFHKLPPKVKSAPKKKERCEPQELASPHLIREEKYGLGAMIDSLYEYLLKVNLSFSYDIHTDITSNTSSLAATNSTSACILPSRT
jgi:mannosyl-oligosaccharide alpha-1,2-mannosidase